MQNVIAFIEHTKGTPRRVSLEAATQARKLADALGGKAHAVVVGNGAPAVAEILKKYPLDQIHVSRRRPLPRWRRRRAGVGRQGGRPVAGDRAQHLDRPRRRLALRGSASTPA